MWKMLTILGLVLVLLIPLHMIGGVIQERQSTKEQAVHEISQTWGEQ
jgi:inner membrane protein involved in colicin E2 resistance